MTDHTKITNALSEGYAELRRGDIAQWLDYISLNMLQAGDRISLYSLGFASAMTEEGAEPNRVLLSQLKSDFMFPPHAALQFVIDALAGDYNEGLPDDVQSSLPQLIAAAIVTLVDPWYVINYASTVMSAMPEDAQIYEYSWTGHVVALLSEVFSHFRLSARLDFRGEILTALLDLQNAHRVTDAVLQIVQALVGES